MATTAVPMDDAELMRSAMTDEQPAAEPERRQDEAQAEPAGDQERPRDEHGRFAPREKAPEQAAQQPQAEGQQAIPPPPSDDQAFVPSWRVREIREELERKAADAERVANERYQAQVRQFIAEQQARQQPAKPPDMLADPDAWQQHLIQEQQGALGAMRMEFSEMMARATPEGSAKVDTALKWLRTEGHLDPSVQHRINASRHPFQDLLKLYDQSQTLSQIGGDLGAYKTRLLDEALNDPAFLQRVAEKLRADQGNGSAPANGQRPVVNLPPSLSKIAAARVPQDAAGDLSDASLMAYALAPGRR